MESETFFSGGTTSFWMFFPTEPAARGDTTIYFNLIGKQNLANPFWLFFSKSHHDWPLHGAESLKLKAKSKYKPAASRS